MKRKLFTNTEYNVQNILVAIISEEISVINHKDIPQWFTDAIIHNNTKIYSGLNGSKSHLLTVVCARITEYYVILETLKKQQQLSGSQAAQDLEGHT